MFIRSLSTSIYDYSIWLIKYLFFKGLYNKFWFYNKCWDGSQHFLKKKWPAVYAGPVI